MTRDEGATDHARASAAEPVKTMATNGPSVPAGMGELLAPEPDSIGDLLARGDPHVWRSLLAEHVPDHTGHCRSCQLQVHPCRLRGVAEQAELAYTNQRRQQ